MAMKICPICNEALQTGDAKLIYDGYWDGKTFKIRGEPEVACAICVEGRDPLDGRDDDGEIRADGLDGVVVRL